MLNRVRFTHATLASRRAAATGGTVAPPSYRDHTGDLWIGGIGDGLLRVRDCVVSPVSISQVHTAWKYP